MTKRFLCVAMAAFAVLLAASVAVAAVPGIGIYLNQTRTLADPTTAFGFTSTSWGDLGNQGIKWNNGGATAIANLTGYLQTGYDNGNWTFLPGTIRDTSKYGLTSSTAYNNRPSYSLGIMDGASYAALPYFSSHPVAYFGEAVQATDALVMYTWAGDANFDGQVSAADYSRIDNQFAFFPNVADPSSTWLNGDFNHDGMITAGDYSIIDNAFAFHPNELLPASQRSYDVTVASGASAVPEPGTLALVICGALAGALVWWRRK